MIKSRTKFVLTVGIGLSLFSGLSQAMFLKKGANDRTILIPNPSAPARLGALALIHDDERFSVLRESGEINEIPNHLVARDLRGISQDEVKARLDNNINFRVQQGSDGEFSLQECGGLKGGGYGETVGKKFGVDAVKGIDKIINEHGENIGEKAAKGFGVDGAKEIRGLGEYAVTVTGGIAVVKMAYHGLKATGNGISNVYYFFCPTLETQNKDFFQRVFKAYNICLAKHLTPEDGVKGTPYACTVHANQLNKLIQQKMAMDAMNMGEATQSVEIEHNAQQVRLDSSAYVPKNSRLDFEECLRQNPLAEDIVGIPSACIGQFSQLKTAVDAMEVRKDIIQN